MSNASMYSLRLLLIVATIAAAPLATAADWGSIKGRFVADGPPPQLTPLVIDKDEFCKEKMPKNGRVLIGKDNALANAVVYLFVRRGTKVEVHPDFSDAMKDPSVLDNHFCSFHPRVTAVRTGQPLLIKNTDPVGHNTRTELFNETIGAGEERTKTIDKAFPLPTPVSCGIHPFMQGYLLIQDHPYMAVSGDDGAFEIKNVPAGKQTFQFWHETGYLKGVKLSTGTTSNRGQASLTIEPGKTLDLGTIKVPASLLNR